MSLTVHACTACGHVVFPARALCPRCGASEWRAVEAADGVVQEETAVGGVAVVEVRTDAGPVVVARADGRLARGARARLDADGGVPVASPRDA